jgi:hypothetical protein
LTFASLCCCNSLLAEFYDAKKSRYASFNVLVVGSRHNYTPLHHIMARINATIAESQDSTASQSQEATVPAPISAPTHEPGKSSTQWIFALEIGGSHNIVTYKGPEGVWKFHKWSKGAGVSGLGGGVNIVPTMTALRLQEETLKVKHGYEAYDARTAHRGWHLFRHLKDAYAYTDSGQTGSMEPALKTEQDIAVANGWDIHDIADKFFTWVLKTAVGEDVRSPVVWINIVDYWPNVVAQRLKRGFETILPGAQIRGVNEVFASAIGAMERSSLEVSEPTSLLYVDCGHTTMVS